MVNLHPLTAHITPIKLYPQNGERIVTIDSVTSFHPSNAFTGPADARFGALCLQSKRRYLIPAGPTFCRLFFSLKRYSRVGSKHRFVRTERRNGERRKFERLYNLRVVSPYYR